MLDARLAASECGGNADLIVVPAWDPTSLLCYLYKSACLPLVRVSLDLSGFGMQFPVSRDNEHELVMLLGWELTHSLNPKFLSG